MRHLAIAGLTTLAGCDDHDDHTSLFVNGTSATEVVAVAAYRAAEAPPAEIYDPPIPASGEAPMNWHPGDSTSWFVDVHLPDGRVGTTSWPVTTGPFGVVEPPGDFVLSDEALDLMFASPPE